MSSMWSRSGRLNGCCGAATVATWVFSSAVLAMLFVIVSSRHGNLAWDDSAYLWRGLANARVSSSTGLLMAVPIAFDRLLHEQPKPPWLIAWVQLGASIFGRGRLDAIILFSTVVPYAFLVAAVVCVGRSVAGVSGGLLSLILLASSPGSLAFGAKVMVETFLSLWVLLVYSVTCRLIERPSRRLGALLGIMTALAFLTKLTTILMVPVPLFLMVAQIARPRVDRSATIRSIGWAVLVAAIIAGPWYAFNGRRTLEFAMFAARFDQVVEDLHASTPVLRRLIMMAADLPGWPLIATLTGTSALVTVATRRRRRSGEGGPAAPRPTELQTRFAWMAALGLSTAAFVLLFPSHFDTRFLLPIWPVVAVAIGTRLAIAGRCLCLGPRLIIGAALAFAIFSATARVVQTPTITTYWQTAALIDDLVRDFGIHTLGNVGNCEEWNVCKTGLINELRDRPDSCVVLRDLTKLRPTEAQRCIDRFDALIVLEEPSLRQRTLDRAFGLNRSYRSIVASLAQDPAFFRIVPDHCGGLPRLAVYIHREYRMKGSRLSDRSRQECRL